MSAIVIDTNVLLVASGRAAQMSDTCLKACCARLQKARSEEQVVVDNQFLILGEYQRNLDANKRPPSPGSEFVRYLLQHMSAATKVARIDLTPTNPERDKFAEFPPDASLEAAFDRDDRKFVAAAYVHPDRPNIVEAADSKWLGWEAALKTHGINLEMPCRAELRVIRDKKLSK